MIFHVSIPAHDPLRVARTLGELLDGEVMRFLPGGADAYQVYAGRAPDQTVFVEVLPSGRALSPDDSSGPYGPRDGDPPRRHAFHFAAATDVTPASVAAICAREGWRCQEVWRGPAFFVQEIWIENELMIELLTPEACALYARTMTPEAYRAMMGLELHDGVWVPPHEAASSAA